MIQIQLDEGLLYKALDYAMDLGCSYAEVRYQLDEALSAAFRNGKMVGVGKERKEGVGIRVLYGGSLGFSATNVLNWDGLKETVEKAFTRARALSKLMKTPIEFSTERLGRARYSVVPKRSLEELDLEEMSRVAKEIYSGATSPVKEAKVPVVFTSVSTHLQVKRVVNSDGANVEARIPRLSLFSNLVLAHPQKGTVQRMLSWGASGGAEWLVEWRPVEETSNEVKVLEEVLLKGIEPPKEPVDVVLGPEVVGLMVHESSGHPMEADRILGREAAQAGESFVKPEMIGKYRIGSELVTIVEDPTIPGSSGYYLFDDEGVPARPRYLYLNGVINEPLHNRHTARLFGTSSNGAARSMDYASEPIIRMSNTYFKPGDMSFEELIEDIKLGVYIKTYMEWNIDDVRWNQRYVGLESYIIRDGELREYVRNPVFEVTTKGLYSKVVGVDRNLRFYPGTCGKGEPAQGVPVWFGGPNIRLSKIRVGVTR